MKSESVTIVDGKTRPGWSQNATKPKGASEKNWVSRRVKLEIFHCDGHTDEMTLDFPIWTWWGEPSELAVHHLTCLVCDLSRHFIAPIKIKSWFGSVADDNVELLHGPFEYLIPEGKVYVNGKWTAPEEINKMAVQERYS